MKNKKQNKTFRTFDPLEMREFSRRTGFYITLVVFLIFIVPVIVVMPNKEGKIVASILLLGCIIGLFLLIKFYNWRYNGIADVIVSRELVEVKKDSYQRIIFSINSIKKIVILDKPTIESPDFNFFTIYTSSSGNVKLRFMEDVGKDFLNEILKYKQLKRKVSHGKFLWWLTNKLETYYF